MATTTTAIKLDPRVYEAIAQLAAELGRPIDDLVEDAVLSYLARNSNWDEKVARLDSAIAAIQAELPPDLDPQEIEAEITRAREEYRQELRARRASSR